MRYLPAIVALLLAGCVPDPKATNQPLRSITAEAGARFTLVQAQRFYDDSAYDNERGVYLLTDTATGKVYVGVSGIGITELDTTGGKHPQEVER